MGINPILVRFKTVTILVAGSGFERLGENTRAARFAGWGTVTVILPSVPRVLSLHIISALSKDSFTITNRTTTYQNKTLTNSVLGFSTTNPVCRRWLFLSPIFHLPAVSGFTSLLIFWCSFNNIGGERFVFSHNKTLSALQQFPTFPPADIYPAGRSRKSLRLK